MGRRITILGMGASANERRHDIAKYVDGTEIWCLNNGYATFPKLSAGKKYARFFELHSWQYLQTWEAGKTADGKTIDHWGNLNNLGCPVYTGEKLPFIKNQVLVDWNKLGDHFQKQLFCGVEIDGELDAIKLSIFFRGSPSLMLAIALYEHDNGDTIDYIQSYGIDTVDPSHVCQRASWSFWISQALARGIKIGGTMAGFMLAPENDAGLIGLQDMITRNTQN